MTFRRQGPEGSRAVGLPLVLLLLVPLACGPQPYNVTREATGLRLVAASSCEEVAENVASDYEATRPWVTVTVEVLNNALAAEALRQGQADVALLSWPPNTSGKGLWMEPFARDGVAVIVHPGSSFSEIELTLLREIFLGRLQETHGTILTVVSREKGSGTRAAFETLVLEGAEPSLNAVVTPSAEAMIDYVAGTPSAVGYASTGSVDGRVRALLLEGVLPTDAAISSGRYPISRDLYLASAGEPTGEARQLAQWILRNGSSIDSAVKGIVAR